MQVTELFTSELEKELVRNPHGNLGVFCHNPTIHCPNKLLANLLSELISGICMTHNTQRDKAIPAYIDELRHLFTTNCEVDYSMDELAALFIIPSLQKNQLFFGILPQDFFSVQYPYFSHFGLK